MRPHRPGQRWMPMLVALGLAASACEATAEPSESLVPTTTPEAVSDPPPACVDAELHFDAELEALMLANCVDQSNPRSIEKVWAWDGATWRLLEDEGPDALVVPGVAFDTDRGMLLRYGGLPLTSNDCSDETWEWDGAAWEQRDAAPPAACDHMKLAYDVDHGVTLLFGGRDAAGTLLPETWTWDGREWLRAADDGPPGRAHFELVHDPANQRVLLWGGYDGTRVFDDAWSWDGAAWTRLELDGPSARSHAGMAVGADGILMFGGATGPSTYATLTDESWVLADDAWSQLEDPGPPPRGMPALGYDPIRDVMVLYGGFDATGAALADTWEWDGSWRCVDACGGGE